MLFKVGDTVRVKPREWMEALPKWRTGEPLTPDGGLLMPRHFNYAGKVGAIGHCLEQVGGGMYALRGHPYYFPESCLDLAEPGDTQ